MTFSLSHKTIWEMGKMQAKENFVTYTEFGEKTQIVILMRQYDLECKFKKKHYTHLLALSNNQISFLSSCFYSRMFSHLHIPRFFFPFHLKIQKN